MKKSLSGWTRLINSSWLAVKIQLLIPLGLKSLPRGKSREDACSSLSCSRLYFFLVLCPCFMSFFFFFWLVFPAVFFFYFLSSFLFPVFFFFFFLNYLSPHTVIFCVFLSSPFPSFCPSLFLLFPLLKKTNKKKRISVEVTAVTDDLVI